MKGIIFLVFIFIIAQGVSARNKVVYGEDNRLDYYQSTNTMYKELALSTAAMISNDNLSFNGDIVEIEAPTLAGYGVCSSELFAAQMIPANCSGFLVGDDILVTAGHCMQSSGDCRNSKWVFDFAVKYAGDDASMVETSSVYSCKKILSQSLDENTANDFAIIKLDRKVTGRAPLKFRTEGKLKTGTPLVVIGHPTGLPTKIAAGANVRSINDVFFTANLDTFGGNSGSAVFNGNTGEVEGILVRGDTDYLYNSYNDCYKPNYCENSSCRGEDSTLITNIGLDNFL